MKRNALCARAIPWLHVLSVTGEGRDLVPVMGVTKIVLCATGTEKQLVRDVMVPVKRNPTDFDKTIAVKRTLPQTSPEVSSKRPYFTYEEMPDYEKPKKCNHDTD